MSCQFEANHDNMVFMQMTSCHLIPMWHAWNMNADDVMMTWFVLYANPGDVTLGMCDANGCAWCMCSK